MIWTHRNSGAFQALVNDIHRRLAARRQTTAMLALANAIAKTKQCDNLPADHALVVLPFWCLAGRERSYAGEAIILAGLDSPLADDETRAKLAVHLAKRRIGRGDLAGACVLLDLVLPARYRSAVAWGVAKALIASGNLREAGVPLARLARRDQDAVWRQAYLERPDPWSAASFALLDHVADRDVRLAALQGADDRHLAETGTRHPALRRRRNVMEAARRGIYAA